MRFQYPLETTAPPERIWQLWIDMARWPPWDTALFSAHLDGSFSPVLAGQVEKGRA